MRVAFAGDWHGNGNYSYRAMKYAKEQGADVLLHTGDFGVWSPYGYLKSINDFATNLNLPVYFVDGNHEDHPWLNTQPIEDNGFRKLGENLYHIPRGHRWDMGGVSFLGLGGAHSVDSHHRRAGFDWFPEEHITMGQAMRTAMEGHADVMITHDCPTGADIPGIAGNPHGFPPYQIREADRHRDLLRAVVDEVKPSWLFHGHYHVRYNDALDNMNVVGLDCDGSSLDKNIYVVDTEELVGV